MRDATTLAGSTEPTRRERVLALVLVVFGVFVALGSAGELVAAFAPGLLPDDGAALAELHRNRVVATWVVVQNLVTLPVGIALARGARRMLGDPSARASVRRAGLVLLAITVIGQVALAFTLYPDLLASGDDLGIFWVVSLASAGAGVAFMATIAVLASRRPAAPR